MKKPREEPSMAPVEATAVQSWMAKAPWESARKREPKTRRRRADLMNPPREPTPHDRGFRVPATSEAPRIEALVKIKQCRKARRPRLGPAWPGQCRHNISPSQPSTEVWTRR